MRGGRSMAGWLVACAALPAAAGARDFVHDTRPFLVEAGAAVAPSTRAVDLRTLPVLAPWRPGTPVVDIEAGHDDGVPEPATGAARSVPRARPAPTAIVDFLQAVRVPSAFGTPQVDVPGINFTGVYPPDPTGDVGASHYVQAVNGPGSQFAVRDKATGALLAGPSPMSALASGVCAGSDAGDPQVLHDGLADRWLFAYIAPDGANNRTWCVLVSGGGNVLSTTWTQYAFAFTAFPDYPKLALWNDAYGVVINQTTAAPNVQYTFAALDRARMLAGQPATMLTFRTTRIANNTLTFAPIGPVGLKGFNPPKPGAPMTFAAVVDDELFFFGDDPGSIDPLFDQVYLYTLMPDFANPPASVTTGPAIVQIPDLQVQSNRFPLQPDNSFLPSFSGTVMHRVTYRNLGDTEDIVLSVTDVVDTGGFGNPDLGLHVAPVWLRLQRATPANPWTLVDSGRFRPGDPEINRFLPVVGIDSAGGLALAYSTIRVNPPIAPSLWYTGKLATDPPGTMPLAETVLATGAQSQAPIAGVQRWGDYFDLSLDPDGCRFWFTGQYMDDANWGTRVASFAHDTCGPPAFTLGSTTTQFQACSASAPQNLPLAPVRVASRNAFWRDVGLAFTNLPAGFSGSVAPSTVRPSADVAPSLAVAQGTPSGTYTARLTGTSSPLEAALDYTVTIDGATTAAPAPQAPADGATAQPLVAQLSWAPIAGARDYVVEGSTSATFGTLLFGQVVGGTQFDTPVLPGNTTVFWRVRGRNLCGEGANSPVRSFTTLANYCATANLAVPAGGSASHVITVPATTGLLRTMLVQSAVNNIPVANLRVDLTRVSDATTVNLLAPGCSAGTTLNTNFGDAAPPPACNGSALGTNTRAAQPLAAFDGASLSGQWRMTVGNSGASAGTFVIWCLKPQALVLDAVFGNGFE